MSRGSEAMQSVVAAWQGWREGCLRLAGAREDFLVEGFSEADRPFFKQLCRRQKYRQYTIERGLLFLPEPWE